MPALPRVVPALLLGLLLTPPAHAAEPFSPQVLEAAREVRDRAVVDDVGYEMLRTFDKVDPQGLRENIAAYGTLAYLAAQYEGDFGRAFKPKPSR